MTTTKQMKEKPCPSHRLAFPGVIPEVFGMQKHGVKFKQCGRCGWVIKA